ncbi:MAG: putative OsmC-like protein [Gammaproteobacteria bacterium]|jgi:uncharacterized OsmC-like protein
MHAPLDDIVEIDNASDLFVHAKHPKSFVSLDQAEQPSPKQSTSQPSLPSDGIETVACTAIDGFKTDLVSSGHALIADEPARYGGTEQGPSPFDLLCAALASCTTMTLAMYAQRKKLKLRASTVHVTHSKVHAQECEDCETDSGKIDEFQRVLHLDGDFDAQQRQRLLEIADRCPVHRSLHNEVKVRTTLAD